jgi:superfamily II DNA helicase RecQ
MSARRMAGCSAGRFSPLQRCVSAPQALTATATEQVAEDIKGLLQLRQPVVFRQSFNRTNLSYEVRRKSRHVHVPAIVASWLRHPPQPLSADVYWRGGLLW